MRIILEEGDDVALPFNEFGKIKTIEELPWMTKYWVTIWQSNGFNEVGEVVDYFERDLQFLLKQ